MTEKNSSLWRSVKFVWQHIWHFDKTIPFFASVKIPCQILNRLVDVYVMAMIISAVTSDKITHLMWSVIIFSLCKLITDLLIRFSDRHLSSRNYRLKMMFTSMFASKYMTADFSFIESTSGKDLAQRAKNTMANTDYRDKSAVESFSSQCASLLSNLLSLIVYTGIIAILNPLIIVLLFMTTAVNYGIQKLLVHCDQKDKRLYVPLDRKLWYLIKEVCDHNSAKDIRLYGLMGWLQNLFDTNLKERMKLHAKHSHRQYVLVVIINVIQFVFTGFTYWYLILQYRGGAMDAAAFVLYFGLITGFNAWLITLIDEFENLRRTLFDIDDLRQFCEQSEKTFERKPISKQLKGAVQFENVSLHYGNKTNIIEGMNFTIRPGEKIAIVGMNGAGKTTLVKLLCGFYQPSTGHIRLDGYDISEWDSDSIRERMSVVFQDVYLLPTTIERNITLSDAIDPTQFKKALLLSGMHPIIEKLPQKQHTVLVKSVFEGAVELSGGEMQKLALARALYKDGDIFILDEPTAKLDPLSESDLYQKYNELIGARTAIFISHRLSSTRFCDRIFYLENGVIEECGTHDELMRLGKKYAHMYDVQSRYYQQDMESEYA